MPYSPSPYSLRRMPVPYILADGGQAPAAAARSSSVMVSASQACSAAPEARATSSMPRRKGPGQPAQQFAPALRRQFEHLPRCGPRPRLGPADEQTGLLQPGDRRVQRTVTDRADMAGQAGDPGLQLIAVQGLLPEEAQDRQG